MKETLEQALDDEAVRFRKRGAEIDRLEVALKSKDCEVAHWKQRWATEVDALAEQMRALLRGAGEGKVGPKCVNGEL